MYLFWYATAVNCGSTFTMNMKKILWAFVLILAFATFGCDNNVLDPDPPEEVPESPDSLSFTGTGSLVFTEYEPLKSKPVNVFFHIPATANSNSPILIALHGNGRDAKASRDWLIDEADALRFIVIAPEFSSEYYGGSDSYHLGNIFEDGDRPSPETLNPEEEWTYSIFDHMFIWMRDLMKSKQKKYDLFGHSAGGQVAHRFFMFKPNSMVNNVIAAAPGWYTLPDTAIDFPYGFGKSPALDTPPADIFGRKLIVIVGANDIDPNSAGLRHNSIVDKTGLNRFDRAKYFDIRSKQIAQSYGVEYNWEYYVVPNVAHSFEGNSAFGAKLLYY